ncbi:MAG: NERD domain-containing protein/DEAD/DEAH box helicase [Chloroflexi bacterium]|nr:NERD domain-containing protein/DEAD/DEAH box helicase [Chloroflexota bacterium]
MESRGKLAERLVDERVRTALPADAFHLYPNAEWLGPMRDGGPARDGEADLVIVHEDLGLLVLEVKSGTPTRDHAGRWWLGDRALDRDPFNQAGDSKHQLVRKLQAMADWSPRTEPRAGHAIALPDVDLASLPRGHVLLGADAPTELVLDGEALETPEATRRWVERAYGYWLGDGSKGAPLGAVGVRLLDEILAPTWTLHRLVRGRIEDDRAELVAMSREQVLIVSRTRRHRRLEVVGPAGSGKSMLAAAKARHLAHEGYRTLLVCFNQRLATSLMHELADAPASAGLDVTTFHRLCERLGTEARVLPQRPEPIPQTWWDETLPGALAAAIDALPDARYHAVIVDEGQDFEAHWFELLQRLLIDPDDVFWVFHDPGQALIRTDVVAELRLERHELFENHRNPESIAALAARFYRGGEEVIGLRETGRRHTIITAEPGDATREALRTTLHRLVVDEQVPPWKIAVLSGEKATASAVWHQRRYGNAVLVNEAIEADGRSKGLPPEDVPDEPDEVLFETIRRFKGMEREVIILVELPTEGDHLDELLYVGLTRATTELVVIAPPELAGRLG